MATQNHQSAILESDVPLSQSVVWRLQREYYVRRGLKAWSQDSVPNFITNNPFIAEAYARIILGFLEDCAQPGLPAAPLRILELGAGTGKLSYLLLRHLERLLPAQGFALEAIRYCMTDCSEGLIESWRSNPYLAGFADRGILDFEALDVSGEISPVFLRTVGPLVVIANYVFDSLPQDAFMVKDGEISEFVVTTRSPENGGDAPELSRLQLSYKPVPVCPGRYPETSWDRVLELYRAHLPAATVLFPSSALKTLQALSRLADGRLLVLAADKGFAHEDALPFSQGMPALEFHSANCFSQMVNFDAIGKHFYALGGQALLPDKHFSSLNICGFVQGRPDDRFPQTATAYREAQAFGADDLFTLLAWLNAHMEEMAVPEILAVLRLTCWDPIAFMRLFPVLARQLQTVVAERYDIRAAVMKVWDNHFPVVPTENEIAFQCGVVLLGLRFFEDAIAMFKASQRIFGPSAATSYNLSLCLQGRGRQTEALACVLEACKLDPNFEPARLLRKKLEKDLS